MSWLRWSIVAGYSLVAVALLLSPVKAEVLTYKADLKGTHEFPPNKSAGAGTVRITYDTADKKLSWSGNFNGLSGPVTVAHFHGPAGFGKNAGIALSLGNTLPSPFEGSAILSDSQAAELSAGRWYLDLHTAAFPAGEIRGQVVK